MAIYAPLTNSTNNVTLPQPVPPAGPSYGGISYAPGTNLQPGAAKAWGPGMAAGPTGAPTHLFNGYQETDANQQLIDGPHGWQGPGPAPTGVGAFGGGMANPNAHGLAQYMHGMQPGGATGPLTPTTPLDAYGQPGGAQQSPTFNWMNPQGGFGGTTSQPIAPAMAAYPTQPTGGIPPWYQNGQGTNNSGPQNGGPVQGFTGGQVNQQPMPYGGTPSMGNTGLSNGTTPVAQQNPAALIQALRSYGNQNTYQPNGAQSLF